MPRHCVAVEVPFIVLFCNTNKYYTFKEREVVVCMFTDAPYSFLSWFKFFSTITFNNFKLNSLWNKFEFAIGGIFNHVYITKAFFFLVEFQSSEILNISGKLRSFIF